MMQATEKKGVRTLFGGPAYCYHALMPRPLRAANGGYVYHALNRSSGRVPLFDSDGKERGQDPF
jgi:hypothetical protein